jgi:flagellar basal-body rod protein FlgF
MDNGIYIALSRQTALFRNMEITSNNIANVNTPGFNAQRLVFSDFLVKNGQRKDAYANDPSTYRDTSTGSVNMTGNTFDLAINGPGYFQVQTNAGRRYTKAGNFSLDASGTLINASGYPVLGADGGQIIIPSNVKNVSINGAGQVTGDGEQLAEIGMVEFQDQQRMTRQGNTLYDSKETPQPAEKSRMVQGGIESSNISPVSEMVKVMEISRTVGNTAKFVETMYDLERKTASTYTHNQTA